MTLHTPPRTDAERIAYLQELMDRVERTQAEYQCAKRALEITLRLMNGATMEAPPPTAHHE